jgi:hypothetical protein
MKKWLLYILITSHIFLKIKVETCKNILKTMEERGQKKWGR